MTTASATELVTLTGGLCVPLPSLQLLWSLEDRGFRITVDTDGYLVISPRSRLTTEDDQAIRQHRDVLIALVRHCEAVQ
ncbi:MAG TPA: hypothetical protein VNJ03_16970 [Vicinamibacterales bacterium]|nr:hypothetical protein [Vicinamibacterales bacterium]